MKKDKPSREKIAYFDYMKQLQAKYGKPSESYFKVAKESGNYRKNPKISRTKEGLYVHHIAEYYLPILSLEMVAKIAPFSYQEPDMLAYCDLLEHLLAHIMIAEALKTDNLYEMIDKAGIGGLEMIVAKLNDWYNGNPPSESSWEYYSWLSVKDRRSEFKGLLKRGQRALCAIDCPGSLKKLSQSRFPWMVKNN